MKKIIIPVVIPIFALSCVVWYSGRVTEEVSQKESAAFTAQLRPRGGLALVPLTASPIADTQPEGERRFVVTEYKSEESEQFLWECLQKYSPNDVISAAVMGYFWRESFFRSDSVSGWATVLAETGVDISVSVTAMIDEGLEDGSTREMFIYCIRNESGGYGLGQWFSTGYLESLYDFAQQWGTSIGDAEMQCAFVIESLKDNTELWEELMETDDAETAGELVAVYYDGTSVGVGYIGDMAKEYYDKYHADTGTLAIAA